MGLSAGCLLRAHAAVLLGAIVVAACGQAASPVTPTTPGATARAASPSLAATATSAAPTGAPVTATAGPSASAAATAGDWNPPRLALQPVAGGLQAPLFVGNAGDDSGRLFVIEQAGRIRIVRDGALLATPFIDLTDRIGAGGERGLLGLTFSRTFASDGLFYVNYTDRNGDTVVSEFRAPVPAADSADPASERVLLRVPQPFANHNGGGLAIAPDGTLVIATGDGGSGGDPQGNGQRLDTLLGKLLRIDPRPEGSSPYGIPDGNPVATGSGGRPEIWHWGLRNPWRFSFDRETGDLWVADVGQNAWEEVNVLRADGVLPSGGRNLGWNVMEATHCFEPRSGCVRDGLTLPVAEYDHGQGCSVTGGFVARGPSVPGLAGTYVFGDYCSGRIWGLDAGAEKPQVRLLAETGLNISSFGEDEAGDLYITGISGGTVSRLVAAP